jgi:geranylgeranyl reductase family protein
VSAHPSASADVLVVGGGPAGSAAAIRLASRGHRVIVVERGNLPHAKACGGLLTPRTVSALRDLELVGLERIDRFHGIDQVRITAGDRSTATTWPSHPLHPARGYVASRQAFDQLLAETAEAAGATILVGHEATAPIVERGFVRGASVTAPDGTTFEVRAGFTVVADGANSRFGRALGTFREPTWPWALAQRAVYESALHDAAEIELVLDLRDRAGTPITGFGWLFPRGDGTANVGVMMMSTSPSFQVVNPLHLLGGLVAEHAERWRLADTPVDGPAGGRLPLGISVGPAAGPTYLSVGDAVGAASPWSGAGIEYALDTGRIAGDVLDDALRTGSSAALQEYPQQIGDRFGQYYKVGRLANRLLGHPSLSRGLGESAAGHRLIADAMVRITTNELRPARAGVAEIAYRVGQALNLVLPAS